MNKIIVKNNNKLIEAASCNSGHRFFVELNSKFKLEQIHTIRLNPTNVRLGFGHKLSVLRTG